MKVKKLAVFGMCCCLLAAMVGCSNKGNTDAKNSSASVEKGDSGSKLIVHKEGLPIVDEQQSLSVLTITNNPEINPNDVVIQQEIAKETNVKIDWNVIPTASWSEKKGLTLAQKDLPDIMLGDNMFTDTDLLNMVEANQIIPLDDLIEEYAPRFKWYLEYHDDLKKQITASDGHIYALPQYIADIPSGSTNSNSGGCTTNRITYINKKWLDKLGLEIPTTTDELAIVLKAFKEQDPNGNGQADEIPLTTIGDFYFDDWFGSFGIVPGANESQYKNISIKDGKVVYAAVEEEYKKGIEYFHKLWSDGLIDPEVFTQDQAMFNAKLKSSPRIAGMFSCWRGTAWRLSNDDTEYVVLPPLKGPEGDQLYPENFIHLKSRAGLMITSSCKNPELAMRWADNLLTSEHAYEFWSKAKIGYHIEMGDGRYNILKKIDVTDPEQIKQVMLGFTCVDNDTMQLKPIDPDPLNVDNEKGAADKIYSPHYPEHYPNTFLTLDEGKEINDLKPQIDDYALQMLTKWITTGGIENEWDNYVKKMNSMGLQKYLDQYISALERYNKN